MNAEAVKKEIRDAQQREITEYVIYRKLAASTADPDNRRILESISEDELKHYGMFREYTGEERNPSRLTVWIYYLISRIFGLTFGIKLMERGEERAQEVYSEIASVVPEADDIIRDENDHEEKLIEMIDEERLRYVGSMIRGLNDALVELTGALAGFTLALREPRLIAAAGIISGVSASLSMGATEYLASKSEQKGQSPVKASLYTGTAYILTVVFLIFPYLVLSRVYFSMGIMVFNAIMVIFIFNFYISISKDLSFWKRFGEMALISLGIAAVSFLIGFLVRRLLGVSV